MRSAIEKGRHVGEGTLGTLGLGVQLSAHALVSANTYFGEMDEDTYLDPNPFDSSEFAIQLVFAWLLH